MAGCRRLGALLALLLLLAGPLGRAAPASSVADAAAAAAADGGGGQAAPQTCGSEQPEQLGQPDDSGRCASCGGSRFPTPGACVVNGTRVDPGAPGCCADAPALLLLTRLLDELGGSAHAATAETVARGNSPFGAAILANRPEPPAGEPGDSYPLLYADANQVQTAGVPTAHGEISTINGYFTAFGEAERVPPGETIFLATHQPCSLCLSGLAFAGFRRVFYGFDFGLQLNGGGSAGDIMDVAVLEEVFTTSCGRIDHTNGMFTIVPLRAALAMRACGGDAGVEAGLAQQRGRYEAIRQRYSELGEVFQARMAGEGSSLQLMASACVGCKPFPRAECPDEIL